MVEKVFCDMHDNEEIDDEDKASVRIVIKGGGITKSFDVCSKRTMMTVTQIVKLLVERKKLSHSEQVHEVIVKLGR